MIFPKREVTRAAKRQPGLHAEDRHGFKLFRGINRLKHHHQFIFAIVIAIGIISFWHGMTTLLDATLLARSREFGAMVLILFGLLLLLSSHYFTRVFVGEE
jgi:hypothetical protein